MQGALKPTGIAK
ncbi:hypothetical protein ZEAMMB73_Zm00001d013567, partial [Zea mays]